MARHAQGRYLIGICDLHSNADTLSALRGPDRLCLDLLLTPELVDRAMREVRRLYQPVYNGIYDACELSRQDGTIGWAPFWCPGKFATIQCDFSCMVSPETARRAILPALEEEAEFLDHCVYHLDGKEALVHLDDILAIKKIDVIQWVSGAGQKPMWQWLDVLKKIQRAGKGLWIYEINAEQVKQVHKELDPTGVLYSVDAQNAAEIEDLAKYLEQHT
jgi:5-methyltetrahydrofolate--homocysteine methyltransferase